MLGLRENRNRLNNHRMKANDDDDVVKKYQQRQRNVVAARLSVLICLCVVSEFLCTYESL